MTRQRMHQAFLIRAQCLSIPDQAECSEPLIVTCGDTHERHRPWLFGERPGCANLLGYRLSFHFALTFPGACDQPTHGDFRCRGWSRHGVEGCLASAVNRHASPKGIEP